MIQSEIDDGSSNNLRRMVVAVLSREFRREGMSIAKKSSKDMIEWKFLVDACMDRILWDRDYMDFTYLLDAPPDEATAKKEFLRIDENYFVVIPPDP
jgi:hypothetical protein